MLLRLARTPPAGAAALADVPGVGAAVTERLGGAILRALAPAASGNPDTPADPLLQALKEWRSIVSRTMGVPAYAVCTDSVLHAIATQRPRSRLELAAIRGVGPRLLEKFGADLVPLSVSLDPAAPPG